METLKSIKSFKANIKDESKIKGGTIVWTKGEAPEDYIGSGNIGTYVDGFNMGTDGYED